RIPRPLYVQHHRRDRANTSRVRNAGIQEVVAIESARYGPRLDQRLTALGATPHDDRSDPLTDHLPLPAVNAVIDVVAEAAADVGWPLVSVVIPTYQRPETLRRAVDSALGQSYSNIEVLVVGDACPNVDEVIGPILDPRLRHANLASNHADQGT